VCEYKDDLGMAVVAGEKAQQMKLWCQGDDFPDYGRCAEVVERVKGKLGL
jgi:hypothetical protein